ncbi:hypothetical protein Tco_1036139 [Tanacetum coccineum]
MEPGDSLIIGNEELSTIPEKESDEFIKSSIEDLIPIPRESEDTSSSDSENVLPSSDDFSPIFAEKSRHQECKDSYVSNLDESTFLVTPLSDSNEDECLAPGDDIELLLHHDLYISIDSNLQGFIDEPPSKRMRFILIWKSKETTVINICNNASIDDLNTEDQSFQRPGDSGETVFLQHLLKLTLRISMILHHICIRIFSSLSPYALD